MLMERITDFIASAGATSLIWAPWFTSFNDTILLPVATILGIIWLLVQIYYKIFLDK